MSGQMDELIAIMREILKWTKFAGAKEVRTVLVAALDTEQKRLVYYLSDGKNGTADIGKASNVSGETVRQYWLSWARQGIVEPLKVQGGQRYKKSFDLEDFNIPVPQSKSSKEEAKEDLTEGKK